MRIALATVGTTGDVAPFATLARRLVERGHEVTAITWPVHRTALAMPGVRVEVAGPHADPNRIAAVAAEAAKRGPMDQVAVLRDFHLADGAAHYRRLRELLPGNDLVLLHGIHVLAHAAAMDTGGRWATVTFDPVLLPTATAPPPGMPNLGPANRMLWNLLDRMLQRTARPLDEVLQVAGSPQRGLPLFRSRSPLLHLVACSPSVMRVPNDLPTTTRVTGAWLDGRPPAPLPDALASFLADGAAPVALTFGSMSGASDRTMVDAIGAVLAGGRRVVVQDPPSDLPPSPSLLGVRGHLDHRALFPRTAAVVHHGGAGTTHAVVAAGVPSVVVPHVGDQRYWADRLHRLDIAPPPHEVGKVDPRRLADAILAAAGDLAMRSKAAALGERVAAEDGLEEAVKLLERAARAPAPDARS